MTIDDSQAELSAPKKQAPPSEKSSITGLAGKRAIWLLTIIAVILADQLSKWHVMENIIRPALNNNDGLSFLDWYTNKPEILPYIQIQVTSFFNVVMAWNTGVSFSMLNGLGTYAPYILVAIALAITILFSIWLWKVDKHRYGLCYSLVIGGALGNVIDRSRFHAVIDFLDVHAYGYHWPAFNVSDMAVVTGISLLIIVSLFFDIEAKQRYRKSSS